MWSEQQSLLFGPHLPFHAFQSAYTGLEDLVRELTKHIASPKHAVLDHGGMQAAGGQSLTAVLYCRRVLLEIFRADGAATLFNIPNFIEVGLLS